MKIEYVTNPKTRQVRVRLVARNGNVLFTSEPYKRKRSALDAVALVKWDFSIGDYKTVQVEAKTGKRVRGKTGKAGSGNR